MAGREGEVAELRAGGGLSTRGLVRSVPSQQEMTSIFFSCQITRQLLRVSERLPKFPAKAISTREAIEWQMPKAEYCGAMNHDVVSMDYREGLCLIRSLELVRCPVNSIS